MKKALVFVVIVYIVGLFMGYLYTKESAPNSIDFRFSEKFTVLVSEELSKLKKSNSWEHNIATTLNGPVLEISVRNVTVETFRRNIEIRQEIIEKVLSPDGYGSYIEDFENIRPLAKEIAESIIKAQQP